MEEEILHGIRSARLVVQRSAAVNIDRTYPILEFMTNSTKYKLYNGSLVVHSLRVIGSNANLLGNALCERCGQKLGLDASGVCRAHGGKDKRHGRVSFFLFQVVSNHQQCTQTNDHTLHSGHIVCRAKARI